MPRARNTAAPLKDALARSARDLIAAGGVEALTVREVAAGAGVTANAPYFHYRGGAPELIAAAAILGFGELREALGPGSLPEPPVEAVREMVFRYVAYGVRNAGLYRAMFHQHLAKPLEAGASEADGEATYARLRELKRDTYEDLVAPLTRLALEGSLRGRQDPHEAPGLALAALAHGLVGEFNDEGLLLPAEGEDPWTPARQAMATEVSDVLLLGLLAPAAIARLESAAGDAEPMRPEDDPSWRLYGQTILEFFPGTDPVRVDLRAPLDAADVERLRDRGLPDSFAVLTAWNPRGRSVSDEENARRDRALKERLRAERQVWVPVDGVSPDGRHRERGVAVGLSRDAARLVARDFQQSAIYWVEGEGVWLVGALVEAEGVRLGA